VIRDAAKLLPTTELKVAFLDALAELSDNECHRTQSFPKTRLHKIRHGSMKAYRADIDKISGWRLHVQYGKDGAIHLIDIIPGQEHDDAERVMKAKKERYAQD